jgi:D-alanyl-D-alanine dipeptidase
MRPNCFLASLALGAAASLAVSLSYAGEPDAFAHSTQMIVVTTSDWNGVEGWLRRYERGNSQEGWRQVGDPISIVVGSSGMGWGLGVVAIDDPRLRRPDDPVKKEGDGRSPAGIFALGTAFGEAPEPLQGLKMPYLSLTPSIECVDDSRSHFYNRIVDRSTVTPDWNSSEHMRSVGEKYRWGIVVGHNGILTRGNHLPRAGAGSCVFLHIWGDPGQGTAGCTAMARSKLESILTWLDPMRKPLLVQLPAPEYARMIHLSGLPLFTNWGAAAADNRTGENRDR